MPSRRQRKATWLPSKAGWYSGRGSWRPADEDRRGTQLASTFVALGGAGTYEGLGRVLKKQGRLDFWFDFPADITSRPIEWGDTPGPDLNPDVCCYELLLLNGVYDSKKDTVTFGSGTAAQLVDYCANEKISPDGATASLLVQFVN